MTLKEIAERIDKSPQNEEKWFDLGKIAEEFGIYSMPYVEQTRLRAYWIGNWYCTDSWVGYKMYFFDDKPVAVSTKRGRKWDEEFEWFSKEAAQAVKAYLYSLVATGEDNCLQYEDINHDIGDSYLIEFNAQVLDWSMGRYDGKPFEFIERIKEKGYGIDTNVRVRFADGEEKIINVRDVEFLFHVNDHPTTAETVEQTSKDEPNASDELMLTAEEINIVMNALAGTPTCTTAKFADKVEKILKRHIH